MNDPFLPFVTPTPEVPLWRAGARALRRSAYLRRRETAPGPERKLWNSRLNWREFWHGRTRLESFPRVVQVGTNWTCNLKCSFCRLTMPWTQAELKKLPGRELSVSDKVEAVIERLLPYAEMMTLTPLGEPLLWRGLKPLLELHRGIGSRNLAMTTNGMLMTDATAELLVRGEVSQLYFSIDSNDPEVYAGMRVGGDLRQVEEGVRRVVAWKKKLGVPWPFLTVNSTFMLRNVTQLPSMVGWARDLGFDQFSVQLMEIENPEQEQEFLGYHPQIAREMVTEALRRGRELGFTVRPHLAIRNLVSAAAEGRAVHVHDFNAASPIMPDEKKVLHGATGNGSYGNIVAAEFPSDAEGTAAPGTRPPGDGSYGVLPESADQGNCASCQCGSEGADAGRAGAEGELDARLDMRGKTLVEKCHYPWYNLLIDTDGDARPCCWADVSWGNLNQLTFDEIWNGEKALAMRQSFLANKVPPSCQKKHCRVDL